MSMTREEIIEAYESAVFSSGLSAAAGNEEAAKDYELLKAGLTALRGPTREMVERMRGEWMFPIFADQQDTNDPHCQCSECGSIETPLARHRFCPACGSPMTDEAVDMMLERWKEAVDNESPLL